MRGFFNESPISWMKSYLEKRSDNHHYILTVPNNNLGIVVVIPSYAENKLLDSLQSLLECQLPQCAVEVVIVFNESEISPEDVKQLNREGFEKVNEWSKDVNTSQVSFYPIYPESFPQKKSGVGLARKTGMDEAVRRFLQNESDGVIACFDADSKCTPNYLTELWKWFVADEVNNAVSIHYEHPLADLEDGQKKGIILYESHLRYFVGMQQLIGLPFAFQTVGSAMAVRASAYCKEGGMPLRKAGEDFYFLHKFIKNGRCTKLNTTSIYPSARVSDRVPFGTGKAIGDFMQNGQLTTYDFQSFQVLKIFIDNLDLIFSSGGADTLELHIGLKAFLLLQNADQKIKEIKKHTTNYKGFEKRFYQWFDAFMLMKYLHYMRDHYYPNISVEDGMTYLFKELNIEFVDDLERNLIHLRVHDMAGS